MSAISEYHDLRPGASRGRKEELIELIPLLWEIGNLKRLKPAHLPFSFAADLFCRAWSEINSGVQVRQVALKTAAAAVVAAELGAIDQNVLERSGLTKGEILTALERAFDSSANYINENLRNELRAVLLNKSIDKSSNPPLFAKKLTRQPRSGATKLNAPKLVFDQPENHAEHSIIVGVYGVLLAPLFGADLATVFLAALAHHFHNADLPDSGFAGEELLGDLLPKIFQNLRENCVQELPENLREKVRQTFALTQDANTSESKTFHAADVIDRVLQMRHHADANRFSLEFALDEMDLVHAGAIQAFHYEILREAGLIS